MILPQAFRERMTGLLGEEAPLFFSALDEAPRRGATVDLSRCGEEALARSGFVTGKIPYEENGVFVEGEGLGNHLLHLSGALYLQDPGAMAPVAAVPIREGFRILDLCAAPGGKSIQAARKMGKGGVLVSNEFSPARCKVLLQNLERCGVADSAVLNDDGENLPAFFGSFFDLVILDAPCSGEGMFRKNPESRDEWNEGNIRLSAERQKALLGAAALLTRPGGYLSYSTCTFAPEENEWQIADFLSAHPEFSLCDPGEAIRQNSRPGIFFPEKPLHDFALCRRFYPHASPGEGQFLALLKKSEAAPFLPMQKQKEKPKKPHPDEKTVRDFLREVLVTEPEGELLFRPDGVYLSPPVPLPEKRVFSPGIKLGTVRKGRMIPSHRFFTVFAAFCRNRIELFEGDERIARYLHGEELENIPGSGWAAVFAGKMPLGGAKISDSRAKNFYPKGLRAPGD